MKKIFISYSSVELNQATDICNFLEEYGYKCFIANRNLVPGKEYAEQLLENMDKSGAVVLLLSEASNASPHVLREVEYAVSHNIPIIVYKLEEVEISRSMKYFLMTHQWIDDSKDKKQELLKGVRKLIVPDEENVTPKATATVPQNTDTGSNKTRTLLLAGIVALLLVITVMLSVLLVRSFKSDAPVTEVVEETVRSFTVGETVTFGTYYNEPIEWRVLRINDDNTVVLLAKNILTMKSFDAPEGGEYNYYDGVDYWSYENHIVTDEELVILIRGNNDWSVSNLRTWLNSDREVVTYPDQEPTKKAVGDNFYYSEPGFLYNFSEEEKNALVPVTNKSTSNSFSKNVTDGFVVTEDLVYLLSTDELAWIDEAEISPFAFPTEACEANDNYSQYYNSFVDTYNVKSYYWWLRDNPGEDINKVYVATTEREIDENYTTAACGSSDFGVRPVITISPKEYSKLYK